MEQRGGLREWMEWTVRRSRSIILLIITIIIQVRVYCYTLRATANKCCCQPSRNNLRNAVIQVYLSGRTPFVMCRVTVVVVCRTGILIEDWRSIKGVRGWIVCRGATLICVFVYHCGTQKVLQILPPHTPETIITPEGGA